MSKHTPGPWEIVGEDPGCMLINTSEGESIASVWNLLQPDGSDPCTPMQENARLVVAAPEMSEALEIALAYLTNANTYEPETVVEKIVDALSKSGWDRELLLDCAKATWHPSGGIDR